MTIDDRPSIYFDGGRPLCSRGIAQHVRRDRGGVLRPIDIAREGLDARSEGLDPQRVHHEMHVRIPSADGVTGARAFAAIWRALGWHRLAGLAERRMVLPALDAGYHVFARVRPLLPRRDVPACADSACAALPVARP